MTVTPPSIIVLNICWKDVDAGALVYMLKPDERGTEPPHWLCANCYGKAQK